MKGSDAKLQCEMASEHFDENINSVVININDDANMDAPHEQSSLEAVNGSVEPVSIVKSDSVPDIFNPEESLTVPERSLGSTQQNSACSVYENLPEMNFDLSGQSVGYEEDAQESFTSLQNKFGATDRVEEMEEQPGPSNAPIEPPVFERDISDIDLISYKVGMKVFALWNKVYYPGVIQSINDSATVTIHFHDDQIVTMPKRNIFSHNFFSQGQKTKVKLSDEYYQNATIMSSFQHKDEMHYTVCVDDQYHVVARNFICFNHIQRQNLMLASNDREITSYSNSTLSSSQASRKRRQTEPLYSSESDYFIAVAKTPARKLAKRCSPPRLFDGMTFYIIPEDAPVLCQLCVNTTSSTEAEQSSGDDFSFNFDDLNKLIKENGGVVIPKLHGRDLQRASRFVCIAKSESACLEFVYAVVAGIPVLHFDWVHRSLEAKEIKPYERREYVLPAGTDIFGETVEQDFGKRPPYTPLNLVRLYVHTGGELKNQNRLLDMILSKVGCQRFFGCMHVTKKTKKLPFDITRVDFVLTLVNNVPRALVDAAELADKKIATATWFVQCLINNQLYDVNDCPAFTYSQSLNESNAAADTSLQSLDENEEPACDG